jgi:hypothetical protein
LPTSRFDFYRFPIKKNPDGIIGIFLCLEAMDQALPLSMPPVPPPTPPSKALGVVTLSGVWLPVLISEPEYWELDEPALLLREDPPLRLRLEAEREEPLREALRPAELDPPFLAAAFLGAAFRAAPPFFAASGRLSLLRPFWWPFCGRHLSWRLHLYGRLHLS